jgi:hypothetical protein
MSGAGEAMGIEITMTSTQPPEGEVVAGGLRQPFVGWLQLLRILVEVVALPVDPPTPPPASEPQGATS